jgi:ubiquinone/menaquinone biosynthesis C-methylase UbiE
MSKVEAFNIVAGNYDDWYMHPQGKQVFEAELNALMLAVPDGIGVEIGAGTGIFAESLSNNERVIICLDPSFKMLSRAKDRGLPCILGYGESLPFRIGLIEFIYMVAVIEFIDDPVDLLTEIKNTSKNEAPLVILFINRNSSWGELYQNIGDKGDPVFKHATLYTLDEVRNFLCKSNYYILFEKGTLNSEPIEQKVDKKIIVPSEKSGVIVVKAQVKGTRG